MEMPATRLPTTMAYDRARSRRPLYAPPPPRRSNQHSVLGYWVPLVVTGTIALGGLAAWVWSERSENDNDSDEEGYRPDKPPRPPTGPTTSSSYPGATQQYPGPPVGDVGGLAGVHGHATGQTQLPPYSGPLPSQSGGPQGMPPPVGGEAADYYSGGPGGQRGGGPGMTRDDAIVDEDDEEQQTFLHQARGLMRRTPSPQQFFEGASRQWNAGIAAAGSALGSIMEDPESGHYWEDAVRPEGRSRNHGSRRHSRRGSEREGGFSDHERWSEEAEENSARKAVGDVEVESERRADQARRRDGQGRGGKKNVAVVLSADTNMDGKMDEEDVVYTEHASILSHLPTIHDPTTTDLHILIYAPGLTRPPPLNYTPRPETEMASNLGSSYSQIMTPAQTPGSELPPEDRQAGEEGEEEEFPSPSRQFDALYQQALTLVSHPSKILCFTTLEGYLPLLRHLAPRVCYISDMLARGEEDAEGKSGTAVEQLKGWVGQTVLVVGDEGTGGLADTSDTENEEGQGVSTGRRGRSGQGKWWERSPEVGLGKSIEIVDAARVGEDWGRRVSGRT
ncbi:hypothetical protein D0867_06344 [Hortaea werneckii]|uniref:Uncharacterized protein n=2 Tax=Hortaea werneckii TaxID=91943 RepID=A0A3M6ZPA2_HORWE|nr:hypothetical protein D0867_06344 [Hortaea werneckii]